MDNSCCSIETRPRGGNLARKRIRAPRVLVDELGEEAVRVYMVIFLGAHREVNADCSNRS